LSRVEGDALLESLSFGLKVTSTAAVEPAGQVAALTAANLLARIGGSMVLDVVPAIVDLDRLPWKGQLLDSALQEIVIWAGGRLDDGRSPDVWVSIGGASADKMVAIWGDDWTAQVDVPGSFSGKHPLGASAAACMGVARAFHLALAVTLGTPQPSRAPISFSLFTSRPADSSGAIATAVGEVGQPVDAVLVGAGAVANGFAWAVNACSLSLGRLTIVDPQYLDESNLNRHISAGASDIGRSKASILSDFLVLSSSDVSGVVDAFSAFASHVPRMPVVLSTVDNNEARYQIQGTFPPRVLHAATSQEHVAVAVLDPVDGACLGCLFPRPARSQAELVALETGIPVNEVTAALQAGGVFTEEMVSQTASKLGIDESQLVGFVGQDFRRVYATEICGRLSSTTTDPGGGVAPTVSYVSALAGILLAAEFAKLSVTSMLSGVLRNYLQLTPVAPVAAWVAFRDKDPNCPLMCGSEALQTFLAHRD
jgi:molybdopterin/thiamine biosynthesis adenylyltransferase